MVRIRILAHRTNREVSPAASGPKLSIGVGQGKEEDLKRNLRECLASPEDVEKAAAASKEGGQNEDADEDCTIFHQVTYLGALPIARPKSEEVIQGQIKDLSAQENKDGWTEVAIR